MGPLEFPFPVGQLALLPLFAEVKILHQRDCGDNAMPDLEGDTEEGSD